MLRLSLILLAAALVIVVHSQSRPLAAQSVTSDDLAAAALAVGNVPGYGFASEASPPPSAGFVATFMRTFIAGEGEHTEVLADILTVPGDALPTADLQAALVTDVFFKSVIRDANQNPQGFALTGPLGIGDVDQSAVWDATLADSGVTFRFYSDVFMRGRVIGAILYAALPANADPSQVTTYAALQDSKILGSALPGLAGGGSPAQAQPPPPTLPPPPVPAPAAPQTVPSPVLALTAAWPAASGPHMWYTSSAASAA